MAAPCQTLPVVRVGEIPCQDNTPRWLVEQLWGASSVGVIGGAPKCSKTWLGLDLALSVATGTACLGTYAVPEAGPVLVYLAAYTLMNMGAFASISMLSEREDRAHLISDLCGQGYKRPIAALALTICLFSLAGVPPFIGFTAKFVVFRAAINEGFVWLAVVGVVNSLISAFYYLRVVYAMYMRPLPEREPVLTIPATAVLHAPYSDSVFVVDTSDSESDQSSLVLLQKLVQLGAKRGDFIAVIDGLEPGEIVVSTGVFRLRNGMSVAIDNRLSPNFELSPQPENA